MRAASFACNDPFSGATLLETLCVLHGYSLGLQMCQVFSGALIYSHRKRGMRLSMLARKISQSRVETFDQ